MSFNKTSPPRTLLSCLWFTLLIKNTIVNVCKIYRNVCIKANPTAIISGNNVNIKWYRHLHVLFKSYKLKHFNKQTAYQSVF